MEASQANHWDEHQHSNKQQNKPVYTTVKEYIQERLLPLSHVTNSVVVANVANVLLNKGYSTTTTWSCAL